MKITNLKEIANIRNKFTNKIILHCHGVFDILHFGHLLHFKSAKQKGDILVVSITPDIYVNKGPGRPINNENVMAKMLSELSIVDYVLINDKPDAINIIELLKPTYYIKGPDYKNTIDVTGKIEQERQAVEKYSGQLLFTDDDTLSSSKIINRHVVKWSEHQKEVLNKLKNSFTFDDIVCLFDQLSKVKVIVVGEPIIDTYRFCEPQNISSKSPSISARFLKEENYLGGSLAIARHLNALGAKVSIFAPFGSDEQGLAAIEQIKNEGVSVQSDCIQNYITPRKIRYITEPGYNRLFEVTNVEDYYLSNLELYDYNTMVAQLDKYDIAVISDFGHGLFENSRLNAINNNKLTFKALNVQTNSNNFGFNLVNKHNNIDFLSIDEREIRLATANRFSEINDVLLDFKKNCNFNSFVTLGSNGSASLNSDNYMPTFFDAPVDTTGAGDAFFAITSVLNYLEIDETLTLFIGNIYAGLKTKIIGNKNTVDVVDLKKTIKSLLA